MTMKGFLSAAISLLAVVFISSCVADGKDVKCKTWAGVLEGGDNVNISVVKRVSDGFLAGTLVRGDKKYVVVGKPEWQTDNRLNLDILEKGTIIGSVYTDIVEDGSIKGHISINGPSEDITFPAVKSATMPDPFAHPSFAEIAPFTLFANNDATEGFTYGTTFIISKDGNGLQYFIYRCGEDLTDGTVKDITGNQWTSAPYKDGKAKWTRGDETYEIEFYNGFMMFNCNCPESSDFKPLYEYAPGYYSLQAESESYIEKWRSVNDHDPLEKYGDVVYADEPGEQYKDVAALRNMIIEEKIADLVIPVDLAQASKPNIDLYFRAIAGAFPYGLLGEALKAANGQNTDNPKTAWTLDMKNGYAKALVPAQFGDEGVELCYWRGAEGRDVVALAFRFDATESPSGGEEGEAWLASFFRYNPSTRSLSVVATSGCDYRVIFSDSQEHDMAWYDGLALIRGIKLPREGKRIDLLDHAGYDIYSCEWDPSIQWFKWLDD